MVFPRPTVQKAKAGTPSEPGPLVLPPSKEVQEVPAGGGSPKGGRGPGSWCSSACTGSRSVGIPRTGSPQRAGTPRISPQKAGRKIENGGIRPVCRLHFGPKCQNYPSFVVKVAQKHWTTDCARSACFVLKSSSFPPKKAKQCCFSFPKDPAILRILRS